MRRENIDIFFFNIKKVKKWTNMSEIFRYFRDKFFVQNLCLVVQIFGMSKIFENFHMSNMVTLILCKKCLPRKKEND